MRKILSLSKKVTASGIVHTGKCSFQGMILGTDGANDPVVTIYNNTAASGEEVIPTATYDASVLGLNGVTGMDVYCSAGLYVEITCVGTVEVTLFYTPYYPDGPHIWG